MKERHLRLELVRESLPRKIPAPRNKRRSMPSSIRLPVSATPISSIRAVGWNLAERAAQLGLVEGSLIDIAYRIRENDHPDFGGLEIEIMGIELARA